MIRRRLRDGSQDGAAAVEMALLVPLLLLLLYGIVEFGIVFGQDLGMGNGAREGARYAASNPTAPCNNGVPDDVLSRVYDASSTAFLDTTTTDGTPADVTLIVDVYVGQDEAAARADGKLGDDLAECGETKTTPVAPCTDSDPGDRVYVFTEYQRGLSIPFGPRIDGFRLNGRGVFACEYS